MLAMVLRVSPPPGNLIVILFTGVRCILRGEPGAGNLGVHRRTIPHRGPRPRDVYRHSQPVAGLSWCYAFVPDKGSEAHGGGSGLGRHGGLCVITFGFVWVWVPETKDLSLEEI